MSGEGSVYPVHRSRPNGRKYTRYMAQLSSGPRGARVYVRQTYRTKAEAKDALKEMLDNLRNGVSPSRQPLGTYLRTWLDETARPSVSPNTLRGYEAVLTHLAPIANTPIAEVTAEDIEFVLNRMTAKRKFQKVATDASPKTRRNALLMLRAALSQAERRGHLARNPAKLVPLPRVPRRAREALTIETAKAILGAVSGDRYEASYALALVGLRASEILGLAWSDVSLTTVRVRRQLVGSGATATRAQLKSRTSERTEPLPEFVVSRLAVHRQRQREERIAAGRKTTEGLVFLTPNGLPVNGSWWAAHFRKLLAAAGMEPMTPHALRHGFSSILSELGVHPSVQQALLGHASAKTSLDVYTHVTVDQQRAAIERYQEAIG